jgi:hypothetical protein
VQDAARILAGLPGLVPGSILALLISLAGSGLTAHIVASSRRHAFALLLSLGFILAATLTPTPEPGPTETGHQVYPGTCDVTRLRPLSPWLLTSINQASTNVLLFVPLGAAAALLPMRDRRTRVLLVACALPIAIEITQLALPVLGRVCQSSDVADNLTGLALGAVGATIAARVVDSRRKMVR